MAAPPEMPKHFKTMTDVPLLVGLITNSWAKLEHAMVPMTNRLLRTADDTVGKIVFFAMNATARRDLITALSAVAPITDGMKAEIRKFSIEYDRLRVIRNDVVHGFWESLNEDADYMLRSVKSREKLKDTLEPKQIHWLIVANNDIEQLTADAVTIGQSMKTLWPSR